MCMYVYIYVYICICIYIYICVHMCTYVRIYVYVYMCIYVYISVFVRFLSCFCYLLFLPAPLASFKVVSLGSGWVDGVGSLHSFRRIRLGRLLAGCLLPAACCFPLAPCCLLLAVCCLLLAARIACCLLPGAWHSHVPF